MDSKIISIVIATYNAENCIACCLESIVRQLSNEIELIIIDGRSTDKTLEIINQYADSITYLVSEKDNGIYDAWNKGINVANGRWIAFIGADDELLPNALTTYLDAIEHTSNIGEYDFICAHNEYVDNNGRIIKLLGGEPKWSVMRKMMPAAHVASLHNKTNLFGTVGVFCLDFKICADYEMLIRKRDQFKYLMLDAHIARMKMGGMSFSTKAIKETYDIRKKHNSVPFFVNYFLFIKDWLSFKSFIFRKIWFNKCCKLTR